MAIAEHLRCSPFRSAFFLLAILATVGTPRSGFAEDLSASTAISDEAHAETPVRGIHGSLVICGGGGLPESIFNRYLELAGGEKARLVIVTTASIYAGTPEMESRLAMWTSRAMASVTTLHTRSRNEADTDAFTKPLDDATAVWFIGGNQNWLTSVYLGTKTEEKLHAVLERGGVIGGTSAGAAIMSRVMIAGGKTVPEMGTGLGFLPGAIVDQHFLKRNRTARLEAAIKDHPGLVGFGIDESTALVVSGRQLEVVGDSEVHVFLRESATRAARTVRLTAGRQADLVAFRRAARDRARSLPEIAKIEMPRVEHGTLIIVGGGATPRPVVTRFMEAAGGPNAEVVVVTDAQGDSAPPAEEVTRWLKNAGAKTVTQLHAAQAKDLMSLEAVERLKTATGVWFGGGRQWRFVDSYLDTPVEGMFHDVLDRGGVIGGSSAGATIQGDYLVRGNPLNNVQMSEEGYERGFNFLPGAAIDQHFTERKRLDDLTMFKKDHPALVAIGIDEATAIVVRGTSAEVIGKSNVTIFDQPPEDMANNLVPEVIHSGEKYDFATRRKIEVAGSDATDSLTK